VALRPNLSIGLPFSVVVLVPQQNPFERLPKQHKTETNTVRFRHKLSQIDRWDYVQAAKTAIGFAADGGATAAAAKTAGTSLCPVGLRKRHSRCFG
jgi:hypothetical protein